MVGKGPDLSITKPSILVSKPLLIYISYSNRVVFLAFRSFLYRCIFYMLVVGWMLHVYRRKIRAICDLPHWLDPYSNGMSIGQPQGLSFCSACILHWSNYPSDFLCLSTGLCCTASMFWAVVDNGGAGLFSSLSVRSHISGYSSQLNAVPPILTKSSR